MAKGVSIKLDRASIGRMLKDAEFRAMVDDAADRIGRDVQQQVGDDVTVAVESYETDRAAAAVHILDPSGTTLQAVKGVFTSAAAAEGLTVRRSK